MEIKSVMSYHLTLVRMAIIKNKSTNNKCTRLTGWLGQMRELVNINFISKNQKAGRAQRIISAVIKAGKFIVCHLKIPYCLS